MSARDPPNQKIGSGHAGAMARLGLRELREAFNPSGNTIAQPPVYGLYGEITPGEVSQARQPEAEAEPAMDANEEPRSIVAEYVRQAEAARDGRGREDRERGVERGER